MRRCNAARKAKRHIATAKKKQEKKEKKLKTKKNQKK